jgi:hypothetical protein
MKTEQINIDQPDTITLSHIIEPLLELLNDQYPVDPGEQYEIPPFGQFGALEENPNEVVITLPDAILSNQLATRAIATLLWQSGSPVLRTGSRFPETDLYRAPLRFALLKRAFWLGHWQWNRYLIADHVEEELDVEAAERQIVLLLRYLRDPENLIRLEPDALAMF